MASQSNVYPCSSSMSQLICHALTSLYPSLHFLIFIPNTHTFVLCRNQLFNSNVSGQHEFCALPLSSVQRNTCPFHTIILYLSKNDCVNLHFSLKCRDCVNTMTVFFYLWKQTRAEWLIIKKSWFLIHIQKNSFLNDVDSLTRTPFCINDTLHVDLFALCQSQFLYQW